MRPASVPCQLSLKSCLLIGGSISEKVISDMIEVYEKQSNFTFFVCYLPANGKAKGVTPESNCHK
jgi:hypothetical protein